MNINNLANFKNNNDKIAALTCYDASFAEVLTKQEIDVILIGDTLGTIINGYPTTIPVTINNMVYHTKAVVRGINNAITPSNNNKNKPLVISDLPFMSYSNIDNALNNSAKLIRAGCQMVKLEGGAYLADIIYQLVIRGIPVCAHIGLMPQHYHQLGGYKIQGGSTESAKQLMNDAKALEQAGAKLIVLECIKQDLAANINSMLSIATIGIGSGADLNGQILVLYDILGISPGKQLKFARNFMLEKDTNDISSAIKNYIVAVKNGSFPKPENCFN